MARSVLFVQRRAHRAGAQTCLLRLLGHAAVRNWNPIVVCGEDGWFTKEVDLLGVPLFVEPFPSSRSVFGRLFANANFARRVQNRLHASSLQPAIVHGNDHLEGLLGLRLANRLAAKRSIFLRSPGMSRQDYFKYGCDEYDAVSAIGDDLQARVMSWSPKANIEVAYDGLLEEEFLPPVPKAASAPARILVIGSPLSWKGWGDFAAALAGLDGALKMPSLTCDFTGKAPEASQSDLGLERFKKITFNFLGRVEGFRELVRGYHLVVNPSRMETFGMAAAEVIAAGVPLLSSRTGVIERVQANKDLLYTAGDIDALRELLRRVLLNWESVSFQLADSQKLLRDQFSINRAAQALSGSFDRLLA